MNYGGLVLILIGIVLIIVGWRGTQGAIGGVVFKSSQTKSS